MVQIATPGTRKLITGCACGADAPYVAESILETGLETENAATRSVRPSADRKHSIRRSNRHRFVERHMLAVDHPTRCGRRRPCIALAVIVAAAPFAGAVLVAALVDPAVVCECATCEEKCRHENKQ